VVRSLKEALMAVSKGSAGEKKADKVCSYNKYDFCDSEMMNSN